MDTAFFIQLIEYSAISIVVGAATVAVVSFIRIKKLGTLGSSDGHILKGVYSIIRVGEIALALVIIWNFVQFFSHGAEVMLVEEYGMKAIALLGIVLAAYYMTRYRKHHEFCTAFTAGGWYFYSLYHFNIHIAGGAPLPFLTGILYYLLVVLLAFVIINISLLIVTHKKKV